MNGSSRFDIFRPVKNDDVEHWSLKHPEFGLLELFIGEPDALRRIDPDFPTSSKKTDADNSTEPEAQEVAEGDVEDEGASTKEDSEKFLKKLAEKLDDLDKKRQLLVRRDGVTIARYKSLENQKIDLGKSDATVKAGEYGGEMTLSAPYLGWTSNFLDSWMIEVKVKDDEGVVVFDPPEGSRAAKRWEAMEESPFKRWFYPLITGLGKGGWALAVIVLGPLVSRLISWLLSFLPDWDINIPWPNINLPSIPWPDINLPSIPWPEINLPSIPWPDWHMPEWMEPILRVVAFMADYSKVWVPVVIGIAVGLMAVKNNKKSKERKAKWQEDQADGVQADS